MALLIGKPTRDFHVYNVEMWCDIFEAEIQATDQSAQGTRSTRQVVRLSSLNNKAAALAGARFPSRQQCHEYEPVSALRERQQRALEHEHELRVRQL